MPIDFRSPGLKWRKCGIRKTAYWICRSTAVRAGYLIKTQRLWSGFDEPTDSDWMQIRRECQRLQREMKDWVKNRGRFLLPSDRQKHRDLDPVGQIYFICAGDYVKIGFSRKPTKRLAELQVSSPFPIKLIGAIPGTATVEKLMHSRFEKHRIRGEWFRANSDLLAEINHIIMV